MVKFKCIRCHYSTNKKTNFLRHLNRKFSCVANFSTLDIETIKRRYFQPQKSICQKKYDDNTELTTLELFLF